MKKSRSRFNLFLTGLALAFSFAFSAPLTHPVLAAPTQDANDAHKNTQNKPKTNNRNNQTNQNNQNSNNQNTNNSNQDSSTEESPTTTSPDLSALDNNKSCPKGQIATASFGCVDSDQGKAVIKLVNLVANIVLSGVGVLATAGIVLVGIQFAIAGDNSNAIAAARKRLIDIIIGVAIFALFRALLALVLPNA